MMSMAIEPDSAGVRIPPPVIYPGALLSGLAAEQIERAAALAIPHPLTFMRSSPRRSRTAIGSPHGTRWRSSPDVDHFLHIEAPEAIEERIAAWGRLVSFPLPRQKGSSQEQIRTRR